MFLIANAERWGCFLIMLLILPLGFEQKPKLKVEYKWSKLEFEFESKKERKHAIKKGEYIVENSAPIDVDLYDGDKGRRYFLTIPRFKKGVPASLGVVTDKKIKGNNVLKPYPSWSWHRNLKECKKDRIVSVVRTMIDECQRLWVIDNGVIAGKLTCAPQILAFDLKKNKLSHRFEIPSKQIEKHSLLVTPVVDVRDANKKCRDTFIYIADCQTNSIIVYDVRNQKSWKIADDSMKPDPKFNTYKILGDSFKLMDGILGMALSPSKFGEDRKLFYHPMSSGTENWVLTSDLRNYKDSKSPSEIFHTYGAQRNSQAGPEAISADGYMFFGLMGNVTLDAWSILTEYSQENMDIVADDREILQFISGLKVKNIMGREEIVALSSRFQKFATDSLSTSEINFRILSVRVEDLLSGIKQRRNHD